MKRDSLNKIKRSGGGRTRKKKNKKKSKKRPQKASKVTLDDYDKLQEVILKKSEALPKKLEKVNIFDNYEIIKKVFGKYMHGHDWQTEEELDDEKEQLLYKLDQLKTKKLDRTTHKELLPQIEEDIKDYENKIDTLHKKELSYKDDNRLDISLCNKVKQIALADPQLYHDRQFKDTYIIPCSDNKLLTEIYIYTFYTTPPHLKDYFLEWSNKNGELRQDSGIITYPFTIEEILNEVPDKYLSEWAKNDINILITRKLKIPDNLKSLSNYFRQDNNLEDFLDKVEDHLTKVVHVDDMQMDALRENPSDGRDQGWDKDYWRSADYFIEEDRYIGWTKDKLIEKQEQYHIPGVDAYKATWLTIDPDMSPAEVLMRNKKFHHPDFNIEKTKRYLILLLMGLVQNEYFKQDSHEILSHIVNDMETIIEENLGIEAPMFWSHLLPLHFDESEYKKMLEGILEYEPPLKDSRAKELYLKKKQSFQIYKEYYELYEYFKNK